MRADLERIGRRESDASQRLEKFAALFRRTLRSGNRRCLCGMLASEFLTLPAGVKDEVRAFYDETEAWLAGVLRAGRTAGALHFDVPPARMATTFRSTLEGAMIAARTFDDETRLTRAAEGLIASLH
jgi:TetR/AcrR family transcriptional repressor of nem operon